MKETVCVSIYSYQCKNLIDSIYNLIDTFNYEQDLYIYVIDHNNIDRSEKFNIRKPGVIVTYKYVKWDIVKSPIELKENYIRGSTGKWFMQIGDQIQFKNNWNKVFINFLNNRKTPTILSGNNKIFLTSKDPFFITTKKQSSIFYENNNWIDRDFIFCLMKDIKNVGFPKELKYRGEEDLMSLDARIKGYEIFSVPTGSFKNTSLPLLDREYVAFSLTHNYNKFITFLDKNNDKIKMYTDYCFDFNKLNYFPFENNDVLYDQKRGKFDDMDGTRYLNKTRKID